MIIPDPVTTGLVVAGALQIAKQAQDFIGAALGHPGESVATMLGNVAHRRLDNAEAVAGKANLILLNIGVTPKEVPLNIIQPMIEGASLQEDPELQKTWANLMANAADPRELKLVSVGFHSALKELTGREVKFLDTLYFEASRRCHFETRDMDDVEFERDDLLRVYATAGLSRMKKL